MVTGISEETRRQPNNTGAQPGESRQGAADLMRAMGSKRGFTPIPPAQHEWQSAADAPPLVRAWAWMVERTCAAKAGPNKGSPYAVDEKGQIRRFEDFAREVFHGNKGHAHRVWKDGEARGVWRMEGQTPWRLFLNGELLPVIGDLEGEDKENERCLYRNLNQAVLKKLKGLPEETQNRFWERKEAVTEHWKRYHAGLIAGGRFIFDQIEDSLLREFGLEENSSEGEKPAPPERAAPLLDHIQLLVQATAAPVQATCTGNESDPVQRDSGGASLYTEFRGNSSEKSSSSSSVSDDLDRQNSDATDRPTTTPLFPIIKEWLQHNCPVAGFALEDAELNRIAATISSVEDFEDFQAAAKNQKNPQGWRVYVRIAENCRKRREHYRQSKASKPVSEMTPDERERIINEALEKERKAKRASA